MTDKVLFEIVATAKGVNIVQKQTDKLAQSTDKATTSTKKLSKTRDAYNRKEKGAAQISSNQTKNFSKMQQGIDGGGGSGGLVRAYALLAANVFALTAAFGVLSRSAQIDTLTQSMEILSTTGGTYIKSLAKDMQQASGFAIDLAQSFRQVSLAASAGLNTSEIEGLTKVAKGAAISLGRNLPDAMDRIFRGAIKLEPEILDEIGLFIRVDEAAQKYARNNGKVVSALTQVEKRQAFLNEILEQGTKKFAEYAEEIKPDPYVRLGAALGDIAQGALSILNQALGPVLNMLAESKGMLTAVFGILIISLLKKAIPAMGEFNTKIAQNASEAADNAREYQAGLKMNTSVAMQEVNKQLAKDKELIESKRQLSGGAKGKVVHKGRLADVNKGLKVEVDLEKRKTLLMEKQELLEKKINRKNINNRDLLKDELADMEKELDNLRKQEKLTAKIAANTAKGRVDPKKGSLAQRRQEKLDQKATSTTILSGSSNMAEQQGMGAGFKELNKGLKENTKNLTFGQRSMTRFTGTVSILGTGISKLMMKLGPWMMALAILSPLLMKLGKMMGFGSKEAKAYEAQIKKLSDQFENLDKRFANQVKGMLNMELTYQQNLKAAEAFHKNLTETSKGVLDLEKSFTEWQSTANGFQLWWEGAKGWFGFGKQAAKVKLQLEGTKESLKALVEAGKDDLVSVFDDAGVSTIEYSTALKLNKAAIKESAIMTSLYGETIAANAKMANLASESIKYLTVNNISARDAEKENQRNIKKGGAVLAKYIRIKVLEIQTNNGVKASFNDLNISEEQSIDIAENLVKKTEMIASAMGNLRSALEGANESVGKFNQAMMPKTKVDEILGSFNSIQAKITELAAVSEKDVEGFFSGFADADNALAPLFKGMFKEVVTEAEDGTETVVRTLKDGFGSKEIKGAIKEVQKEFDLYRITIIKAKTELKVLADTTKQFAKISAAGLQSNTKQQKAITATASKQLEISKQLSIITIRNAGYKRDEFDIMKKQFDKITDEVEQEKWLTDNGITRIQMLAIENQLMDESLKNRENLIAFHTEADRIQKQFNTELLKQLDLELKVIEAKTSNAALEKELLAAKSGSKVSDLDNLTQTIQVAKEKYNYEVAAINLKKAILEAEEGILLTRTKVLLMEMGMVKANPAYGGPVQDAAPFLMDDQAQTWLDALGAGFASKSGALEQGLKAAALRFGIATANAVGSTFKAGEGKGILGAIKGAAKGVNATGPDGMIDSGIKDKDGNAIMIEGLTAQDAAVQVLKSSYQELAATMGDFGPAGMIVAGVAQGSLTIMTGMENQVSGNKAIQAALKDTKNDFNENDVAMATAANTAEMASSALSGIGQMMAANSKGQIAELDQQIAAEKKRDGKSKESLAKIAAMEKKKEAMQKKAFDQNKKVQMAVTIANTAASIMAALSAPPIGLGPIAGMPMAVMAGAMGALQLAVIAKTKYQGGASSVQQPTAQKMTIGKRDNTVDVSRGSSGGELSYLRGGAGVGSNANDFRPSGGAMGRKGYASGGEGILVGEQGPEVIQPSQRVDIVPNNRLGGSSNVNFSINAVDASGVENLLVEQRGNIIRMIREAANDTGERFLETVDTQAYGSTT